MGFIDFLNLLLICADICMGLMHFPRFVNVLHGFYGISLILAAARMGFLSVSVCVCVCACASECVGLIVCACVCVCVALVLWIFSIFG